MKILCIIDTIGMGGAERQMIGLVSFLKNKGYRVDLVTYHDHDFYSEVVNKYDIGTLTLNAAESKYSKLRAVRKHIKTNGGYDWVIAYKDGPSIIASLLKCFGGKFRLIVSERNTNQHVSSKDKLKFFLYRWADYIVPNSSSQKQFIEENFPDLTSKTVTITNFTDTDLFHPMAMLPSTRIKVLTVARIASQKNLLNYFEAIKKLKDLGYADKVHFDWYGDVQKGEEQYGEKCFNRLQELSINDMITIHSATTNIVKHYQSCDIFCLPSIYEGFPNVICEAMSCGKPIVCSRVCDNPSIVQENINGLFFDPTDVMSICSTLKEMIDMTKEKIKKWGEESRSISETHFSKEAFVQKYIRLLINDRAE